MPLRAVTRHGLAPCAYAATGATCQHPNDDNVTGLCDRPATHHADVSADYGDAHTPVCSDCAHFDMPRAGYAVHPI
jgi:hypothetical protein